jgi:hypothetical protein
MKQIQKLEKIVSRMANLLIDQIEATKEHVEAKFSKTLDELLVYNIYIYIHTHYHTIKNILSFISFNFH